ncbi:MAG: DUF1460 domain-containing protein [Legionellaceae bacterium]|nr:DUF1460 domain-containing protein [Legionellaceae bacterium]
MIYSSGIQKIRIIFLLLIILPNLVFSGEVGFVDTSAARLDRISAQFLGAPYVLGALGEGKEGRYDQFPLYRLDAFDCETFVTSVLAWFFAEQEGVDKVGVDAPRYQYWLRQLRYDQGKVGYLQRNHFTSIDWNQHNQALGLLRDITETIYDKHGKPVFSLSHTRIDKANWFAHRSLSSIRLRHANTQEQQARLQELQKAGQGFTPQESILSYLSFSVLFDAQWRPNYDLFDQIPSGAIVEIVRPDWLMPGPGEIHNDISHLGFVFRKEGVLWFRNASSLQSKVYEVPLIDYLAVQGKNSPTIKGIHVLLVRSI